MINGRYIASNLCDNLNHHSVALGLFSLLFCATFSTAELVAQYSGNSECGSASQPGSLTLNSSLSLDFSVSTYSICDSTVGEETVSLICRDPPSSCTLLLEWPCGGFQGSGFYQCITQVSDTIFMDGMKLKMNYSLPIVGNQLMLNDSPITVFSSSFSEFSVTTYLINGFDFNLSRCDSRVCATEFGVYNHREYFLSTLPTTCPCEGFACCNSKKRTAGPCTYSTHSLDCVGNCSVVLSNHTLVSEVCEPHYPFDTFTVICSDTFCYPSPTLPQIGSTPSILSPEAFWSLLALSIVLFLACGGLVVFVTKTICCRSFGLL